MKILHLADLHLGKNMNGFSLIEDQQYILQQIIEIIDEKEIEVILVAGDVYDRTMPSTEAVKLLDEFLTTLMEKDKKVFMISGNHDSAQRIAFGGQVMKKAGIYVSPVFSGSPEPIVLEDQWGKINVYLLPFIRPAVVRSVYSEQLEQEDNETKIQTYQEAMQYVIEKVEVDENERNIMVAHQFLTGASPSESEEFSVGGLENMDAGMFVKFDYTALGHIHRAQKVLNNHIRYAGTPLKYSFSEAKQQKSVTYLEIKEKGNIDIDEIPLTPLRDCREIKGNYNEITSRDQYIHTNTNDYIHITLTDEEDILQAVSKLRVIYPNLMKVDYDNTRTRENHTITMSEQEQNKSPMDLFEEFYQMQNNQKMTEEQAVYAEEILKKIRGIE